jgi:DNA-binding HxlR family transcriptional regulator
MKEGRVRLYEKSEFNNLDIRGTSTVPGIQSETRFIMGKRSELCPVETTARIVGGRWKAAVLEQLFQGTKRFSELKRGINGITQRTLAQLLRDLQSAGIVERTVHPDTPPRVEYAITPLGKSLRPLMDAMCHWGKSHAAAMALRKLRASDRQQ